MEQQNPVVKRRTAALNILLGVNVKIVAHCGCGWHSDGDSLNVTMVVQAALEHSNATGHSCAFQGEVRKAGA